MSVGGHILKYRKPAGQTGKNIYSLRADTVV